MAGRKKLISKGKFMRAYRICQTKDQIAFELSISRGSVNNYFKRYGLSVKSRIRNTDILKEALEMFDAFKDRMTLIDLAKEFSTTKNTARDRLNLAVHHLWGKDGKLSFNVPCPPSVRFIRVVNAIRNDKDDSLWTNSPEISKQVGIPESSILSYLEEVFEIRTI